MGLTTDELVFRLKKVAAQRGADCPHLLIEAANRLQMFDTELRSVKKHISFLDRMKKKGY